MAELKEDKSKSYAVFTALCLLYWLMVFCAIAHRWHVLVGNYPYILTVAAACGAVYSVIRMVTRHASEVKREDDTPSTGGSGYAPICFIVLIPLSFIQFFIVEYPNNYLMWEIPPKLIVLTCIFWYVLSVIIMLLLNSLKWTIIVSSGLTLLLSLLFYYVELFRGEPLQFLDIYGLRTAMDVAGGYRLSFGKGPSVVIILTLIIIGVALAGSRRKVFCSGAARIVTRVVACAMAVLLFLGIIKIDWQTPLGVTIRTFSVKMTYINNGTVIGFAGLAKASICEPPEGYSAEAAQEVADLVVIGNNQDNGLVTPENIIVVMVESWADYSTLGEVHTNVPILPFYDSLSENVVKGHVKIPTIGGGTVRTEYEFLTGNSVTQVNNRNPFPLFKDYQYSIATVMKQQGYTTLAMHPNKIFNWRRDVAYSKMDFDYYYDIEEFDENAEKVRGHISDKANYDKIFEVVEEKNKNGEKVFLFDVTMQNHGGYDDDDFESTVYVTDFNDDAADQYFTLAHMSDEAIQYLIDYYRNYDVPTLILVFGDHYPKLSTEFDTYVNPAYGAYLAGENDDPGVAQGAYYTPFLIWSNYGMETESGVELSSNYLSTYLLEHTGLRMAPYNYYLSNLRQQIPEISVFGYVDAEGSFHPWDAIDEKTKDIVTKYEYLQYNELIDTGHRLKNFFSLEQ